MAIKLLKILKEEVTEQYWGLAWQHTLSDESKETAAEIDRKKNFSPNVNIDITNIDINNPSLIKPSSKRGSGFGMRWGQMHQGIDYRVTVGTNIIILKPGEVTVADMNGNPGGYGAIIYIKHYDGVYTRYGHLSKINVSVGDKVEVGDVIGKTGGQKGAIGAGNSKGPHLHFEYRPSNVAVDPASGDNDDKVFRFGNDSDITNLNLTSSSSPSSSIGDINSNPSSTTEILGNESGSKISIKDISGMSVYPRKGEPMKPKYFILHHTGGRGSAEDVITTLNNRTYNGKKQPLGIQYIIDRDGKLYRGLPKGSLGAHVSSFYPDAPKDMSNYTSEGVEIVATDDSDILITQCKTALKLVKSLGYSLDRIYGHGEVSSNKRPTEGQTCKKYIVKNW